MVLAGAFSFGLVIGWITYRTLRRRTQGAALSDIATVIGAVGGAAVTSLFPTGEPFGAYSIGLAIGFFGYFIVGLIIDRGGVGGWMMDAPDDRSGGAGSFMDKPRD
jgi:fructose-specific phosphotransferase system IIC component